METGTATGMEIETQDALFASAVFSSCTHDWCAYILLSNDYMIGFMSCALPLPLYCALRLLVQ